MLRINSLRINRQNLTKVFVDINSNKIYAGTIVHRCGRASDSRLSGPGFDPHLRHHVVSLKQGTLTLKSTT